MRARIFLATLGFVCAGCGGSGSPPPSPPAAPPPPPPPPSVSLSTTSLFASVLEDDSETQLSFDVTVTGASGQQIWPNVEFPSDVLALDGPIETTSNGYRVNLVSRPDLLADAAGEFTFRLCQQTGCANVYAGTTTTVSYELQVETAEWTTYQRNARRTGYAPVDVTPAAIAKIWDWTVGDFGNVTGVATSPGYVHVSASTSVGSGIEDVRLFNLRTMDGSVEWSYNFGDYDIAAPPAIADQQIIVATYSGGTFNGDVLPEGRLWSIGRTSREVNWSRPIPDQRGYVGVRYPPVIAEGRILLVTETDQGGLQAFDLDTGEVAWMGPTGTEMADITTPAANHELAFVNRGAELQGYDLITGELKVSIPELSLTGPPMHVVGPYTAFPVIAAPNEVLALSGLSEPSSFALTDFNPTRRLISYDIEKQMIKWVAYPGYKGPPVVADGMVYLGDNMAKRVVALSLEDGNVQWSWSLPPPGPGDAAEPVSVFMGSMVAANGHLFVSTYNRIYAIDTSTHETVWTHDGPGIMSITADATLLIMNANYDYLSRVLVPGRTVEAFRLN